MTPIVVAIMASAHTMVHTSLSQSTEQEVAIRRLLVLTSLPVVPAKLDGRLQAEAQVILVVLPQKELAATTAAAATVQAVVDTENNSVIPTRKGSHHTGVNLFLYLPF